MLRTGCGARDRRPEPVSWWMQEIQEMTGAPFWIYFEGKQESLLGWICDVRETGIKDGAKLWTEQLDTVAVTQAGAGWR